MLGGTWTCLRVSSDPMFLWISLNSCPLNLLFVRSHQTEIIIVKHLIQGRNNMTRWRLNSHHTIRVVVKNDAFTHYMTWQGIQLEFNNSRANPLYLFKVNILYNFNFYLIVIFEVALAKIHGRELLLVKSSCHLPIRLSYTIEASHRLSVLTAERQVGKLWITFCKKFMV